LYGQLPLFSAELPIPAMSTITSAHATRSMEQMAPLGAATGAA
jgi:hypothetical protein